ncbi:hypothetical protein LX69_00544 [Breznakibacter xylanolyticus]|uniref:Uncharacterized protein n=1 Tax=Breznakibacter xylanolyticus TaxID=990 RepID=A0A2W7P9R3_9BACT|nr:hypothetical protein LX69_00544 [Breznakibacter xylanolyticus]
MKARLELSPALRLGLAHGGQLTSLSLKAEVRISMQVSDYP